MAKSVEFKSGIQQAKNGSLYIEIPHDLDVNIGDEIFFFNEERVRDRKNPRSRGALVARRYHLIVEGFGSVYEDSVTGTVKRAYGTKACRNGVVV